MILNVQNSNLQPDGSRETSVFTNTQLKLLMETASTVVRILPTDDR